MPRAAHLLLMPAIDPTRTARAVSESAQPQAQGVRQSQRSERAARGQDTCNMAMITCYYY